MLLLDIFLIIMQWGFSKHVLSKKVKTDIFNKSVSANRIRIVIISPETCTIYVKLGAYTLEIMYYTLLAITFFIIN